jgi:hypothetical protein
MPTYDVAISFAGDDRPVADLLARSLVLKGLHVFYDEYVQAELWGKDLYSHLVSVYRDEAKYCLMIISEKYVQKLWTSHERKAAQARAFSDSSEYILPLRLDDAPVDGVLTTTGYIDFRRMAPERVVDLLVEKVKAYNSQHGITYELVSAERVFKLQDFRPRGAPAFTDTDFTTACPTCSAQQTLAQARMSLDDSDTVYSCKNGCQAIVVIGRPGLAAWPGRGYRLGDYVIRNARDIVLKTEAMPAAVLIPASKAALMKIRADESMHNDDS